MQELETCSGTEKKTEQYIMKGKTGWDLNPSLLSIAVKPGFTFLANKMVRLLLEITIKLKNCEK